MRYSLSTLGCKVNQYDSAAISSALAASGLEPGPPADLAVVNTCCVTATAMRKSRQAISRAARNCPGAVFLVVGCYVAYDAARIRRQLKRLGVPPDKVVLASHRDDIAARLRQIVEDFQRGGQRLPAVASDPKSDLQAGLLWNDKQTSAGSSTRSVGSSAMSIRPRSGRSVKANSPPPPGLGPIGAFEGHSRAFVKVQDGCDAFCTYCIVPYLRSRVFWRPADQIVDECRGLIDAGHREIVLCGVCLGAYGHATTVRRAPGGADGRLGGLLYRVGTIKGLWRVRLSSLSPADLTDELLEVCRRLGSFAPHLHLPLQSGSARILRRMNRPYTPEEFLRAVEKARSALDRPAVTTDVIVGFPHETDDDFERTLALAREARFSKIHIFPFSAIKGTGAWEHRHHAPRRDVVRRRCGRLAELEARLAGDYRRQFVGRTMEAIVEDSPSAPGCSCRAMTDRYVRADVRIVCDTDPPAPGSVINLSVLSATGEGFDAALEDVL